uniref:Uncharacterized protein n=1 Tax=Myotis lucifugus TaxID=59463 RepID=G1Q791_MYOLU
MDSEKRLMDIRQHCMASDSEEYEMDSGMEKDKIGSASASGVHLMGKEKCQEKPRSKRYRMDSDTEPCGVESDLERHALATTAAEFLVGTKTHQLSTDTERRRMDSLSERHTMDLDSESLGRASDSGKHKMKAKSCQSKAELERSWMDHRSESEKSLIDSERQQLDFDYDRRKDSSRRYEHKSARFQDSSERCQVDFEKHWDNFERQQRDSDSKKHPASSENKKSNEFESERHMIEREREPCLIQFESKRLRLDEEQENSGMDSDSVKEQQITPDHERHHLDSENEAQRLGARKKGNRPPDFWRPVFLSPSFGPAKKTEEKHSIQQTDSKVYKIQHVRQLSDEKSVRCKEASPTPSNKEDSQQKSKEKHSQDLSPDPNTSVDTEHKSRYKEHRCLQSFQSSGSQINPFHLNYTPEISAPDCHPTSMSTWSATHSYSSDTRTTVCSKCSKKIKNSHFHKCLMNSDNDSEPDCPPHLQIPLVSKYYLNPKSIRHCKTSWNSPLSRSMDPKHSVSIHCPLHQRDSKYSLHSTSYLHCESCFTPQNLMGSSDTRTLPMYPQNTMHHHGTPGPDSIINISIVVGLKSEGQFNLTSSQFENESNTYETKLVSADNLNNGAKDKPILKDEDDETDSESETDSENEEDPEDENNTKDKKDPKDKSDSDNSDPKDRNAENDTDTNNGSNSSGDADPTSGADSNSDGDSNNGIDSSTNPDSTIDKDTNNNANSNYSTDSEKKYTINSDNASGLDNNVDQDNGTDNTNEAGPNNNRPDPNLNGSSLQNSGPGRQNNRQSTNIPGFNNNGSDLNINGLHPNNSPALNNNNPVSNNNIPVLLKDLDPNNKARPSHATSCNSAFSSNKDADSNSDTKPTSAAGRNYSAVTNYYSDFTIPRFFQTLDSSFVVHTSFSIAKTSYAARPNSTTSNVNVTDTSNTTSCGGAITPSYIAYTNFSSDANYETRFTHVIGSNFVINTNYYVIDTLDVHNSANARKINNLSEFTLEISSSSFIPNIVYGSTPTFVAGVNYISTPKNLTTSTFSDSYTFGRNYTLIDYQKFGVFSKDNDGSVDCAIFMHVTESKDVLDANKCGLLQDFSSFQNHNGIKDPASLNFHSKSNILLLSFDIIVGAEQPDVVKFAISSGAMNQFFKDIQAIEESRQSAQY